MPNPFNENTQDSDSYTEFVEKQILSIKVDDSLKVDVGIKCPALFRMTIGYVVGKQKCHVKFKTKLDVDGNLWVKRVK